MAGTCRNPRATRQRGIRAAYRHIAHRRDSIGVQCPIHSDIPAYRCACGRHRTRCDACGIACHQDIPGWGSSLKCAVDEDGPAIDFQNAIGCPLNRATHIDRPRCIGSFQYHSAGAAEIDVAACAHRQRGYGRERGIGTGGCD